YDADGATSSALALRALRQFGARQVDFLVPNRFTSGYGLTPEVVELARDRGPDLLVTVDNGISSLAGVAAANAAGIDVIVTDHHLPGAELPPAAAIVNPQCGPETFSGRQLAGVGVIFYVMLALRRRLREAGVFAARDLAEPNLAALLDLVALGTVADVARLDRVNRTLVDHGLRRIRAGHGCAGITALIRIGRRDARFLAAGDLGFAVGPRLNAAGRLADMGLGVRCLLEDDPVRAAAIAGELDALNRERREIERTMRHEAEAMVAGMALDGELPAGLCLHDPGWHQGIVGILAGRIKERVHRPVVAFASDDTGRLRGSARSVEGVHVRDVLQAIADGEPGLIERFGGHAMAAGLTLGADRLPRFTEAFAREVARRVDPATLRGEVPSDGALAPAELNLETALALEGAGPWGQGFPEPTFDGHFRLLDAQPVGDAHLRLRLAPEAGQGEVEGIAFNVPAGSEPAKEDTIEIAYRVTVNRYREARLQLVVEYLAPAARGHHEERS
ncbi:MAG: single-stranded-DNA-specific exonuclease RecJ, partial [Gammaproteobacteria bacterium]|nr:single-stranded-DNA-specific exonuclease RecJ [Gammaproteobacteria bacterium]